MKQRSGGVSYLGMMSCQPYSASTLWHGYLVVLCGYWQSLCVCVCIPMSCAIILTIHNTLGINLYACTNIMAVSSHTCAIILCYIVCVYVLGYVSTVSVASILYVSHMFLYLSILVCSVTREASEVRHLSCFPKVICL